MRARVASTAVTAAAAGNVEWSATNISFRYPGADRPAVREVSLDIPRGACTAILGPNGSGKSTLLKMLLRVLKPIAGSIRFGDRPLVEWSRVELARTIGVVPQQEHIAFPVTVRDLVAMGRYPHLGLLRPESGADRAATEGAMARCDVLRLCHRRFDTLSGGERQRVRLARALAQQPRVLALDEPTLALDLRHEMEIFELLRALVQGGVTVLLVTHNLNLAARFADRLVLMNGGGLAAAGAPATVLHRELLEEVYGWPLRMTRHPGPGADAGAIQVTPLAGDASDPGVP
jgi:iron complex transport system ATP-binding protein